MQTIFQRLTQDHDQMRTLVEQIVEDESNEQRDRLFSQVIAEMHAHQKAEERVLYDHLKENTPKEVKEDTFEGEQEHEVLEHLAGLLAHSRRKGSVRWSGRFKVLKELMEHHFGEEEEELFKEAAEILDRDQQMRMAQAFDEEKERIMTS